MQDAHPCPIPMAIGTKLSVANSELFKASSLYRSTIRALQCLTLTRPDISFTVNKLSQFLQALTELQWQACKHVLRYIKGTKFHGLIFKPAASLCVECYANADWGSNLDDKRSTSGYSYAINASYIVKFNGFNYNEWSEQVEYYLGIQNLDLALMTKKPIDLTKNNTDEERSFHKEWERLNRLSLKFLRMTMASEIKTSFPATEYAKEFMRLAKETSQSEAVDKSRTGALMNRLTT
ncbi:uncharacterized protein LOC116115537 [Pistacia vera]|uniref:uncharacterized protein LOC116115537 n=1 Tax=Pistacia vera TaxID=55513 RepID=UPI00126361A4|nr:uncharacterized protein LOC116115537 [Pistacia vera]